MKFIFNNLNHKVIPKKDTDNKIFRFLKVDNKKINIHNEEKHLGINLDNRLFLSLSSDTLFKNNFYINFINLNKILIEYLHWVCVRCYLCGNVNIFKRRKKQ